MVNFKLVIENNPNPEDIGTVIKNIGVYNQGKAGDYGHQPLAIFLRDEKGEIFAGLTGETFWGWLFVEYLWVAESLRSQGYGRQLILSAEKEAKQRGCHHVYLDTFSFQALGFYEKLGYQVFGSLDDFPQGHKRYFLQKEIF